jgi:ubiquinone/menaquinone biosynthesis C-methylase UbiE
MSHYMNHEIATVSRSKQTAQASYNRLSRWYDFLAGGSEHKLMVRGLGILDAQPDETVLEIGFGTGRGLVVLARSVGEGGRVCGIDLSPGMLAVARRRVERTGLAGIIDLCCGDAAALPFEASRFDAIFLSFTLELFDTPEIPVVLSECQRVLRPGGRLAAVAMAQRNADSLLVRLYGWAHRRFSSVVDCRPIPVRQMIEIAGFHVHDGIETSTWGLPVDIVLARTAFQETP